MILIDVTDNLTIDEWRVESMIELLEGYKGHYTDSKMFLLGGQNQFCCPGPYALDAIKLAKSIRRQGFKLKYLPRVNYYGIPDIFMAVGQRRAAAMVAMGYPLIMPYYGEALTEIEPCDATQLLNALENGTAFTRANKIPSITIGASDATAYVSRLLA